MKSAICVNCNCEFEYHNSSFGKFCSNKCQGAFKSADVIRQWKAGTINPLLKCGSLRRPIREYIKLRDGYKCVLCGWNKVNQTSGKCPVEVDHIDGNHLNNDESNLRTICPCCHSLTPTWKNTGGDRSEPRGREYRRKKTQD